MQGLTALCGTLSSPVKSVTLRKAATGPRDPSLKIIESAKKFHCPIPPTQSLYEGGTPRCLLLAQDWLISASLGAGKGQEPSLLVLRTVIVTLVNNNYNNEVFKS